jgi:hypothetical protein
MKFFDTGQGNTIEFSLFKHVLIKGSNAFFMSNANYKFICNTDKEITTRYLQFIKSYIANPFISKNVQPIASFLIVR